MKLVGASNWFVRGPFMLEGLICGLIGALLAVILLLASPKSSRCRSSRAQLDVQRRTCTRWPSRWSALILVGVSLLVGAAGSGITLRRFLRV